MIVWIVGASVLAAVLALLLRFKLRSDGIYQDGAYVGSALLGEAVQPGAVRARFITVRGAPAFAQDRPFEHGGRLYRLVSFERIDDSSSVLRRFLDATCEVVDRDAIPR